MNGPTALSARRAAALVASVAVPAVLVVGFDHRGVHAARSILVPGAGLIDEHLVAGLCFVALGIAATVAWLRWGADWTVLAVVVVAMVVSFALASNGAHVADGPVGTLRAVAAAHEFPLVVLVVGALSWLRSIAGRVPVVGRLLARRHRRRGGVDDLATLPPVDRCRTAAVLALAGPVTPEVHTAVTAPDVERRARRVGVVARARIGGDPFRRDHAPARAALALLGDLDASASGRWIADAGRSPVGTPCSEPGWVRPLDGTLSAIALARAGATAECARWARALDRELGLRRGHRPAWWWTPLGIGAGNAPAWEHAAASGLARAAGLIDHDGDWTALRARALGAAARGGAQPDDERLIAAARLWLALVDDPEATRIVGRPGVRHDPLACALDRLASVVAANRAVLRPPVNASSVPCAVGAVEGSPSA